MPIGEPVLACLLRSEILECLQNKEVFSTSLAQVPRAELIPLRIATMMGMIEYEIDYFQRLQI